MPPPPVDLRAVARELADLDARFIAWARHVPRLVLDLLGERSEHVEVLPRRRPGQPRVPDVVVLVGHDDVPGDEPRVLHVEWQSRVDPTMSNRKLRYGLDLSLHHGLTVRSVVVLATGGRLVARPSARLVSTSNDTETETLASYETIALRAIRWRDLVDPARPARAALLDVAATIASDEQLADLRAIDDVRELADAVKAMLAR